MVLPDQYSHNNPYSPVNPVPILQDNHHPDNRPDRVFYHPIMQTEMMVVAEMLCLFAFLFFKGKDEEKEESSRKPKAPILVCLIPLAMDLIATTIEFVAMNYLSGSVFSITSSIVIVSTAISTKILVRKTFNKYQIIGCMLAIGGVVVTGLAQNLDDNSESDKSQLLLGMILTVISFLIEGVEMVVVQIIFDRYDITPNQFVGICGTAGTVIWTIVVTVLSFVGCPFAENQCVQDYDGNYHLEHVPTFFQDLSGDPFLIIMVIINILVIARYNYDVNRTIIASNAMIYQIISIFSNGFVWIIGILITLIGQGNEEFNIESLNYKVMLMKFAGFVLATIGLLFYNGILFKEKKESEQLLEDPESAT